MTGAEPETVSLPTDIDPAYDGCYPSPLEPCTNPGHTHVPAAAARLRELVAVCEAGGGGDGWLETPWPRARELAADLRVVLGALGVDTETGTDPAKPEEGR